jgi:hypothetical protein
MNRDVLKAPGAMLIAVAMIAGAGSTRLYAMDSNNRYFAYGLGQRSCEDYIKFREKRLDTLERQHERYTKDELYDIVDRIVGQWIAGFLTAHNLYVSDTYDLAGNTTMDELKARLEKICRANEKEYFAEAMITLAQELHPQRVKTAPAK